MRAIVYHRPAALQTGEAVEALDSIESDLKRWMPAIVSAESGLESESSVAAKVIRHIETLRSVKAQFTGTFDDRFMKQYPAAKFIDSLRGAWLLRNSRDLKDIAKRVVAVCAPSVMQSSLLARLDEAMVMPSRASLHRGRIILDVSYALSMRSVFSPLTTSPPVWWMWADSSPMGGADWLLVHIHFCSVTEPEGWTRLAACHLDLCSRNSNFQFDDLEPSDDDEDDNREDTGPRASGRITSGRMRAEDPDDLSDSASGSGSDIEEMEIGPVLLEKKPSEMSISALTKSVCSVMDHHQFIPQALGARAASLPFKVSATLSSMSFETQGVAGCKAFIKQGISGTFDLGTEQGIGEVAAAGFTSHFPESMRTTELAPDDGDFGADFSEPPPDAGEEFLFENLVSVAALLHILDNCSHDVHLALSSWAAFLIHFKAILSLLCNEGPRQAFVHRVLRNGGHHRYVHLFERTFEQHSEHRWNSVLNTLTWLLELKDVLIEVWSEQLFGVYKSRDSDFSVNAITAAIRSKWFWAYCHMLKEVEECIEKLCDWGESCPCHCNMWRRKATSRKLRGLVAREGFLKLVGNQGRFSNNKIWTTCPNRGKNAVGMATGQLLVLLAKLFEKAMGFVLAHCQGLTESEHTDVVKSYSEARAAITTILTLKSQQWTVLPLKLCGLSHFDADVARQCANECIEQFQRCPDDAKHHRVTIEFMSPNGSWRAEVERHLFQARLFHTRVCFQARVCFRVCFSSAFVSYAFFCL